jgi:hypothetical protein
LEAPACLEDHHFRDVLKRFAPRWPALVARHPSAPLGPSATAGRPIGRGNEELSPGAARQAALRHPSRSRRAGLSPRLRKPTEPWWRDRGRHPSDGWRRPV